MDKPLSLSVKDFLIRKMSLKMLRDEETINKIVSHQFSSTLEAMKTNNSVELSGFGKFIFNEKRALKKLQKSEYIEECFMKTLSHEELSENRRHKTQVKLSSIQEYILALKPKIKCLSQN